MQASAAAVEADALQASGSETGDAPVSALPLSPSKNSEVVATAKRRLIRNADKRRIVLAPSPVKSAHRYAARACTHLHWPHGDFNMRPVS